MQEDVPFCVRCQEDFPVGEEAFWTMGELRPLAAAPQRFRDKLRYDPQDIRGPQHLCGNCYYDLRDEEED